MSGTNGNGTSNNMIVTGESWGSNQTPPAYYPQTATFVKAEAMQTKLDAKIPRDVIETRDSGFGKPLSYLAGWYVIARMNEIFGQGNWDYQLKELTKTFEGEVNGKQYVSYLARVFLRAAFPNGTTAYFEDIGFGDGQDKTNVGKCHELASKEAVTDAIKRCAKSLGMSMGLALYDKTQENVEDEQKTKKEETASVRHNSASSDSARKQLPTGLSTISAPINTAQIPKITEENQKKPSATKAASESAEDLSPETRAILTATIKALAAQGKLVIAEFKHTRKEKYGVELVKDLTDAQAEEELQELNKQYNLGSK